MLLELDNQYKALEELIEKSKGLTVLDEEVSHLSRRSLRTNFSIIIFWLIIVFNSVAELARMNLDESNKETKTTPNLILI